MDFPVPSFARVAESLRRELESGRGFVVIRGLPIERYSDAQAAIVYWGIATFLGTPIPQNVKEEYLFAVRDEGYNFERDYAFCRDCPPRLIVPRSSRASRSQGPPSLTLAAAAPTPKPLSRVGSRR